MCRGKRANQVQHRVAPGFRAQPVEDRLDRFLGSLLGQEAGPLVKAILAKLAGSVKVPLRLFVPVAASLWHPPSPGDAIIARNRGQGKAG